MKKSELESMITEIVRKECKEAFIDVLTDLFGNAQTSVKPRNNNINLDEIRRGVVSSKPIHKETKKFCNNPVLNQILSETANSPTTATRMAANSDKGPAFLNDIPKLSATSVPRSIDDPAVLLNESVDEPIQLQSSNVPDMMNFVQNGKSRFAEILKKSMEKSNRRLG